MWDTTGRTNLTTMKLPRLSVVPYVVAEWISKRGKTPNELRVWLEEMMRTDNNLPKRILEVILRICNGGVTDGPK